MSTGGDYYFRDSCRMCLGRDLQKVIELSPTPPGNRVLSAADKDVPQQAYPLELYFCPGCFHLQLGHVVDPKILYQQDYTYVSGTSPVFVKHLREHAEQAIARFSLGADDLVSDIGSNDGTGLGFFKQAGMRVLGVDPATEIARRATEGGIETVGDFFSLPLAQRLRQERGPAKLIVSHNACAHIDDLDSVIEGVKHWLADDGVFVVEVGYFVDVYQNAWFDTFYHEHVDFHAVAPFEKFFARHGMELLYGERTAPQGGSIRLSVQKQGGPHRPDGSVAKLIELERSLGLDRPETYVAYNDRITRVKTELTELLGGLKAQGKRIAGYGAPTKATTLITHFELDADLLDFIVEDNPLKQGSYTLANQIPIVKPEVLYDKQPDYVLILAWNFAPSIMEKHAAYREAGGRFIVPMPEPRIAE